MERHGEREFREKTSRGDAVEKGDAEIIQI